MAAPRRQLTPSPLDGWGSEGGHLRAGLRDKQMPRSLELDGERLRFNLDDAIVPADFQWRAGFERSFPADLAGDYQPPGLIHGSDHGRKFTIIKDVARILFRSCVECHRPNQIAPMPLLSYQDARPWAKAIKAKVVAREMPPWFADVNQG
jgi:hypothetical protein